MYLRQFLFTIALLTFFIVTVLVALNYSEQIKPEIYEQLKFRHIGSIGNRVIAVVGVPGDPNVYYIGAASGGIWKSIDGGENFKRVTNMVGGDSHDMWIDPLSPDRMIVGNDQ